MRIIVNIESSFGLPAPDRYLKYLEGLLSVDSDACHLYGKLNNSWYWVINGVDRKEYDNNVSSITDKFSKLYKQGYIQYFYVGEVDNTLYDTPETQLTLS